MLLSSVTLAVSLAVLAPVGAPVHEVEANATASGTRVGTSVGDSVIGARGSAGQSQRGRWVPPLDPVVVTRAFAPPAHDWLPGHRGVDLLSHADQAVRAAGAGRIAFAGSLAGRGVLVIDHGGLRTTYEPVIATVRVGQQVAAGQVVGSVSVGGGHCGSATCLHLGLIRGTEYLDPRLILATPHARLVPW